MENYARKLALWHTKTFKPIMTHEELEPIMSTLGFIGFTPKKINGTDIAWKEYVFSGGASDYQHHHQQQHFLPSYMNDDHNKNSNEETLQQQQEEEVVEAAAIGKLRLPYPRIDGLHLFTYHAFCDALAFYIGERDLSDYFHVRGMPLHRTFDRPFDKKFLRMNEDDLYVYRDGTLDPATKTLYSTNSSTINDSSNNKMCNHGGNNSIIIHKKTGIINIGSLVSLKDIIVI